MNPDTITAFALLVTAFGSLVAAIGSVAAAIIGAKNAAKTGAVAADVAVVRTQTDGINTKLQARLDDELAKADLLKEETDKAARARAAIANQAIGAAQAREEDS